MEEELYSYEDSDVYEEVPTDETYDEDEITGGDLALIVGGLLVICIVFAIIMTIFKRTFKNFHLKLGDKVEIGLETKEDSHADKC